MAELLGLRTAAAGPDPAIGRAGDRGPRDEVRDPAHGTPALDLDRRIGAVCRRLAALLVQLDTATVDQLAGSIDLLAETAVAADLAIGSTPPAPLERLVDILDCSPVELDLLVLAGLAEEHEGLAGLFRILHPRGEPRPTLGLAARLFCESAPERGMFRRAVEVGMAVRAGALAVGPADAPTFERSIAPADGLWSVLRGIDVWPYAVGWRAGAAATAGLDGWLALGPVRRAILAIRMAEPTTVLVTGDSEDVAFERAVALAAATGVPWARFSPPRIDRAIGRLLAVHALVRGVTPVVRLPADDGPAATDGSELGELAVPIVLAARTGSVRLANARTVLAVGAEPLVTLDRRRMWGQLVPELTAAAASLAARHVIEPAQAARTAEDLRLVELLEGRRATADDIVASIRARGGIALTAGVKLVRPTVGWADLVLPEARLEQLREAVARQRQQDVVLDDWQFLAGRRGARGVRMLFAGQPGTGKTLAAEVLAGTLGLELLVVDLARVVSKWIGETEKNLADVFDAAERFHGVLLFDEADALFGKRTDVSDAHDRYANMESAYLLGRIERFEGLVILSTNLRANVDPAFIRRLEIVVAFDDPDQAGRAALWRCHFPAAAPLAPDVDLEELAALFPVVGGVIRNAALAAAFLAAESGGPIRREHVHRAIQREYEKHGKAFPAIPGGATDRGTA